MSGGRFNYAQYHIGQIAEQIQNTIEKNGKPRKKEYEWEEDKYYEFPEDIILEFKRAVAILKIAEIYANRIDYLLSGDDSEDNFRRRLKEELKGLNAQGTFKDIQTHYENYDIHGREHLNFDSLICLCADCHSKEHKK